MNELNDDLERKLKYLETTKRGIRIAIEAKGGKVNDNDTFRSYAQKIKDLPSERQITLSNISISSNGDYYAETDHAYNKVTVDVKAQTKTKSITDQGIYDAADDECEGYSEVTVNTANHLRKLTVNNANLPETPETTTYKASEDETEGTIGYTEASIDLSSMFQPKEVEVDVSNFGTQTVYNPKNDNLYGYSKVTVRTYEPTGPFTVKYWIDRNLQYEEQVEKHANGQYLGVPPQKEGKMFIGWDPNPVDVTSNLDCYAVFDNDTQVVDEHNNILLSWAQVAATNGAAIPIGAHKSFVIHDLEYDGNSAAVKEVDCYKIAAGEDKTTSTWGFHLNFEGRIYKKSKMNPEGGPYTYIPEYYGYDQSDLRTEFLDQVLLGAMASSEAGAIVGSIKPVHKYTYSYDPDTSCAKKQIITHIRNFPSMEKLFIPSYYETHHRDGATDDYETMGVRYTISGDVPFYRTNIYGYSVNTNPSEIHTETDLYYEFGRFYRGNGNNNLNGYAFVDRAYDSWYESKYGTKYSEVSDYPKHNTEKFTELYVCFCT